MEKTLMKNSTNVVTLGAVHTHTHTHTHTQVFLNNLNNNKRAGINSALKVINKKEIHGLKV